MNFIIETSNGNLHYSVDGEGFPILLLAGGPGSNAAYLSEVVDHLANSYKVILIHQRGTSNGSYSEFDASSITLDAFIQDIHLLQEHLSIDTWNIMGHSWGAMLASAYCVEHRNAINKLILVNSAGLTFDIFDQLIDNVLQRLSGTEYSSALALASKLMEPEGAGLAIEFFKTVTPAYFYDKAIAADFADNIDESFFNFSVFGLMLQSVVSSQFDIRDEVRDFTNPVLCIAARQDIVGFQAYHDITSNYPNCQVEVIEKAGHYCWLEQPDTFYNTINKFLNS